MGAERGRAAAGGVAIEEVWPAAIVRHLNVRGESKLAALFLWQLAGFRPGSVATSSVAIAAELGGSDRAARRWLDSLVDVGFVTLVDRDRDGCLHLYVNDPVALALGRLVESGEQSVMAFMKDVEAAGVGLQASGSRDEALITAERDGHYGTGGGTGDGTESVGGCGTKTAGAIGAAASYPRACVRVRAVDDDVEDEVESTWSTLSEVSQEELDGAREVWKRVVGKWRDAGVGHKIVGDGGRRNVAAFLKTHVLLQRGLFTEEFFWRAAEAPIRAEQIKRHPFALVWSEWKTDPDFTKKIRVLRLPRDWSEGLERKRVEGGSTNETERGVCHASDSI